MKKAGPKRVIPFDTKANREEITQFIMASFPGVSPWQLAAVKRTLAERRRTRRAKGKTR